MPIRDVDAFASSGRALRVFTNRGVNGIDGVTSTALGVAAGSGKPTALLIGDVALLHDLTAWLTARAHGLSLTVLVVNNDGGGIFHFLPVAERTPHFEALFGTPHGLDFRPVADLYGLKYVFTKTRDAYREALQASLELAGVTLIEVKTEREANLILHRDIWRAVSQELAAVN